MTRSRLRLLAALAVALGPAVAPDVARAQVGYPPAASPFEDLVYKQSLTLETGFLVAQRDPAGVAPQSAPLVGLRYAIQFRNPIVLSTRVATAFSERNVIDPAAAPANRQLGTRSVQLTTLDVNLGIALTGFRSWHSLVPEVSIGAGIASAADKLDAGGYRFGTPFALNGSGGVRWVPGGRWALRGDLTDRLYRISYPQSYYQTTGGEAVLGSTEGNTRWTHNPTITIGASFLFDR